MFAPVAEAGGAAEAEFEGFVGVVRLPELIVGGGFRGDVDGGEGEGGWAQGEGGGKLGEPGLEPLDEGRGEGGEGPVVDAIALQLQLATTGGEGTAEVGEGKAFFGLVVVEDGGKVGVGLADLVEEPGVEADCVVEGEVGGLGWGEVKGEADELGVWGPWG